MNETIYPVSAYSGKTFRLTVSDCNGTPITSNDVESIKYSVFKKDMGTRTPVTGHTNVSIPLSSIFSELQTSADTGNTYNFEYRISGQSVLPFADYGEYYLVVFTFYTDGEPYSFSINCLSE